MLSLASPASAYAAAGSRSVNVADAYPAERVAVSGKMEAREKPSEELEQQQVQQPQYGKALGFESVFQGRSASTASEKN